MDRREGNGWKLKKKENDIFLKEDIFIVNS